MGQDLPIIHPGQLCLALLIPLTPLLEIILVMQATCNFCTTRQLLADLPPLHPGSPQLNDPSIFLGVPFLIRSLALLLPLRDMLLQA